MLFNSASDIFNSFLEGIRKQHTAVVRPEIFVNVWNQWALPTWIGDNKSFKEGVEMTEKQINDLQSLRIKCWLTAPEKISDPIPEDSIQYNGESYIPLPNGIISFSRIYDAISEAAGVLDPVLPKYLRFMNIMTRFNYGSTARGVCQLTGLTDWCETKFLRSDEEAVIRRSYYRKPQDHRRVYYTVANNQLKIIRGIGELNINGYDMVTLDAIWMDYLRYPNFMAYSDEDGFTYTIDLGGEQLTEIRDVAVRLYLERVSDPRWKSTLQQEMMQQPSKV